MAGVLSVLDWTVVVVLVVVSAGIGVYSRVSGGGNTTKHYLLGGDNINPGAVAFSLLGGAISAISILGNATEIYYFGTQLTTTLLGCIVGTFIIYKFTIPLFFNIGVVSLNEYLERRYQSRVLRQLASCALLINMCAYMGVCLYAPSLATATVTNLSTTTAMVIMATICTFYITIGGVRAVVYTDVLQAVVMLSGVVVVVVVGTIDVGGVTNVWKAAQQGQRLQFFNVDPSPFVRHTFWSTFVFGIYVVLDYVGLNQPSHQRFMSVKSVHTSQRLSIFFLCGLWCLWVLFFFCGLVAYAVYNQCDPLAAGRIHKPDQIIPYLVIDKFGQIPGLTGLFVAAVYGGVLSTLSSVCNSMVCLLWEDFLKHRPFFHNLSESAATRVIRILSCLSGLVSVGSGMMLSHQGNIFHVMHNITGAVLGPAIGLFVAGIFLPWTNAKGAIIGFLTSFSLSCWLTVGKFMRGGGSPAMLPLSTDGCLPDTHYNFTTSNNATHDLLSDLHAANSTVFSEEDHNWSIYDLSYCYTGVMAILLTGTMATIISFITGPMTPKEVGGGIVNPTCEWLYTRAWQMVSRARKLDTHVANELETF